MSWQEPTTEAFGRTPPPPRSNDSLRVAGVVAAVLLVAAAIAVAVVVLTREDESATDRALAIANTVQRSLERLDEAAQKARPRDQTSLVALGATAERAVEQLEDAEDAIRALEADDQQDASVRELDDAVDANRGLAEALADRPLSASEIAGRSLGAQAAVDDVVLTDIPSIETDRLVAALRRERRRKLAARRGSPPDNQPQSQTSPPVTVARPGFRQHAAFGYQTRFRQALGGPSQLTLNPRLADSSAQASAGPPACS